MVTARVAQPRLPFIASAHDGQFLSLHFIYDEHNTVQTLHDTKTI
jgi:hypothetical protein